MRKEDCDHDHTRGVFHRPLEVVIDADGNEGLVSEAFVFGEKPEETLDKFLEETGNRRLTSRESAQFHAFSSSRWNAKWTPQGPKPNWRSPNPSNN